MDKAGTEGIEAVSGTPAPRGQSYLFLLRVWTEGECQESATGEPQQHSQPQQQPQWHGKLQYVLGHNANYIHDWPALVDLLLSMLPDLKRRDED